ncbi:TerD family protein [Streptomyces sp. MP131-18]|uniref:TerD family protein n=1 Tax=Streptomyces sp. MP131-18 TaxID=1857892 RepID=UPI00097C43AB|nr:TerD family protein [Streptomyces sp. MP131-18]ONK11064.1 General stress protein 16U [Streptomyces sp. MP131-18]
MTAELIRGQNHPLSETRLEIRVSAGRPILAGVTLNDEAGRMKDAEWVAHPASPRLPGIEVSKQAAADHRLAVDLGALPAAVHRVNVMLALPAGTGGPASFGAVAAPFVAVTGLDGTPVASYTIIDLDAESAVVALELYRRNDAWKVRAVGQGYAGGLAAMLHDQGLPQARDLAAAIDEAVAGGMARSVAPPPPRPADADRERRAAQVGGGTAPQPEPTAPAGGRIDYRHPGRHTADAPAAPSAPPPAAPEPQQGAHPQPVAGDATGWSMDERLYNQVWGMFEDLARSTAAYRSAVDFADSRMDRELDSVLSDPSTRVGPAADAARSAARAKHTQLVDQARAAFDRDAAQLIAEAAVVEPALPPAYARWDSAVWQQYRVPEETAMALRLGDLSLPERVDLRIPMLVRLPLQRGLWIDSGRGGSSVQSALVDGDELRRLAAGTAAVIAARLLAAHPAGGLSVHVIDPAGGAATAFAPLTESGALAGPPAAGAAGVGAVLGRLTQRVDLVQMAVRSGVADALPQDIDLAEQLLIVHDFPHGFDDRSVTQLRYLADEGPSVGVHLMMVADREDARAYGPVLDPLFRALLRITPVPDDHLADPWVGHAWTYTPALAPAGGQVVPQVLRQVAAARATNGH